MRKNRSKKEQSRIYEAWKQSSLTRAEFCKQNNISIKALYRWSCKFKNISKNKQAKIDSTSAKNDAKQEPIKFLRINNAISEKKITPDRLFLEIALPNGVNLKANMHKDDMNSLLQELTKWK